MNAQRNDSRRYREHDEVRHSYPTRQQQQMAVEWVRLNRDPSAGGQLKNWSHRRPALRGLSRPGDVLDLVDAAPPVVRDAVLWALIVEFQSGASLAGRIALQAMLPKLSGFALRERIGVGTLDERFQRVIGDFWEVLSVYPTDRRRTRVAANLALDTLNRLSREARGTSAELAVDPVELVPLVGPAPTSATDAAEVDPDWGLNELLDWATTHGWVKAHDADLLRTVYGTPPRPDTAGRAAVSAAYAEGVSAGESAAALRQRAHRARKRLTDAVRSAQRAELLG